MLESYFTAFDDFLRTGAPESIARHTDSDVNPAYLSIYRNGHLKTCIDALAASFPVVQSLVGEDYFRRLARDYVEAHPPTSGSLVGYGHHFTAFLQDRGDEHGLAYLPDAAAIDTAWSASYFAPNGHALTPADVETMDAHGTDVSAIRVTLTPPTNLVHLHHDIVETWAQIKAQGPLTDHISLDAGDNMAMLWRLDGKIHIRQLDAGESALISTLAGVETLQTAAVRAFEVDASFDLATTFAALLQNGILQQESHQE